MAMLARPGAGTGAYQPALCTVTALGLRLNLPLIQAVNYAGTPLQWLMMVPFLRLGETVTGAEPLPLTPAEIKAAIEVQGLGFFTDFLQSALRAGAMT